MIIKSLCFPRPFDVAVPSIPTGLSVRNLAKSGARTSTGGAMREGGC